MRLARRLIEIWTWIIHAWLTSPGSLQRTYSRQVDLHVQRRVLFYLIGSLGDLAPYFGVVNVQVSVSDETVCNCIIWYIIKAGRHHEHLYFCVCVCVNPTTMFSFFFHFLLHNNRVDTEVDALRAVKVMWHKRSVHRWRVTPFPPLRVRDRWLDAEAKLSYWTIDLQLTRSFSSLVCDLWPVRSTFLKRQTAPDVYFEFTV